MQILENSHIAKYTTLKIGGIVAKEYLLEERDDLEKLASFLEEDKLSHILLGGGSNVLIDDKNLDCVLIKDVLNAKKDIEIIEDSKDYIIIKAYSGMYLPLFIQYCAKHGFSGLEGLAGIPGRIGGALAMNVGAFGNQVDKVFQSAEIFSPNFGLKEYTNEDVSFAYRHFSLKNSVDYSINYSLTVKLAKKFPEEVKNTIESNFSQKKLSQPLKEKTAGCAFKNPENNFAGKLLQEANMKGFKLKNMGFSDIHANFMVNYGNGTFSEAIELLELAKKKVFANSNIALEHEIKILSDNLQG